MRLSSQRFSGVNMPHADVNSLDSSLAERLRMNDANFSIALRLFFFFWFLMQFFIRFSFPISVCLWPFCVASYAVHLCAISTAGKYADFFFLLLIVGCYVQVVLQYVIEAACKLSCSLILS